MRSLLKSTRSLERTCSPYFQTPSYRLQTPGSFQRLSYSHLAVSRDPAMVSQSHSDSRCVPCVPNCPQRL